MAKNTKDRELHVESIRHTKDTRKNIPTEELRDFVAEDEQTPKTKLYPRDQWLDLKLVRKGKDKQASRNLIGGTKNHNFGEFYRWIEIV